MLELCAFLVLAFVLYASCLHGQAVFDDVVTIVSNAQIMAGDWKHRDSLFNWRGLTRMTYALNVKLFGNDSFSFHVTNVVFHAINGFLVFQIAQQSGLDKEGAFFSGLIFVAHPLAVSAVAYLSARSVLLSSMFGFIAILALLSGYWLLTIPALILAIWAKEDAAILPVLLALLAYSENYFFWWLFLWIPLILAFKRRVQIRELLTHNGKQGLDSAGLQRQFPQPWYSITSFTETMIRFPLWCIGVGQNNDPDIEIPSKARVFRAVLAFMGVTAALFFAAPAVRVPLLLVCVSPVVLYWFFPMPDAVMEYRAYASLAGIAVLFALLLSSFPVWAGTSLLLYFGYRTFKRAFDYQTPLAYWLGCVRDGSEKNQRVLTNIGASYQLNGDFEMAKRWFQRALDVNPNIGPAMANLALMEWRAGSAQKAVEILENCVQRCPDYEMGRQGLAQVKQVLASGQLPESARA